MLSKTTNKIKLSFSILAFTAASSVFAISDNQQSLLNVINSSDYKSAEKLLTTTKTNYIGEFSPLVSAIKKQDLKMVQLLITQGALLDFADQQDQALMMAVRTGNTALVKLLISAGADLDQRSDEFPYHNALMLAAEFGYLNMASLLLDSGADISVADAYDDQAFAIAAYHNQIPMMELLIKAGTDINYYSFNRLTALDQAKRNYSDEAVAFLEKIGAKPGLEFALSADQTKLLKLIRKKDSSAAKAMITSGIDLNYQRLNTPLEMAIKKKKPELVALLLQHGSDVNVQGQEDTALILAIKANDMVSFDLLMQHKADVNKAANHKNNKTPLMHAIENPEMMAALIKAGANINGVDRKGNTTLNYAINEKNVAAIKLLQAAKANLNQLNRLGLSALDIAKKEGVEL